MTRGTQANAAARAFVWSADRSEGRSSVDAVAEGIRELIRRGDLMPGDRLPAERSLCELLGVSRASLREAIRALRQEGYLSVHRGVAGGTFVTDLRRPYERWLGDLRSDSSVLTELMDVRVAVEQHLAELAAQRRGDDDIASLAEAIDGLSGDMPAALFRQLDSAFHLAIARAAASPGLERIMLQARSDLFVAASTPIIDRAGVEATRHAHGDILQAIRDGDPNSARIAMSEHIVQTRIDIERVLARDASAEGSMHTMFHQAE